MIRPMLWPIADQGGVAAQSFAFVLASSLLLPSDQFATATVVQLVGALAVTVLAARVHQPFVIALASGDAGSRRSGWVAWMRASISHTLILGLVAATIAGQRTGSVRSAMLALLLAGTGCLQETLRRGLMLEGRWRTAAVASVSGAILVALLFVILRPRTSDHALQLLTIAQFSVSAALVIVWRPTWWIRGGGPAPVEPRVVAPSDWLVLAAVAYWVISGGFLVIIEPWASRQDLATIRSWQNLFSGLLLLSVALDNALVARHPGAGKTSTALVSAVGLFYSLVALAGFRFLYPSKSGLWTVGLTMATGYLVLTISRFGLTLWKRQGRFRAMALTQSLGAILPVVLVLGAVWRGVSVSAPELAIAWGVGMVAMQGVVWLAPRAGWTLGAA